MSSPRTTGMYERRPEADSRGRAPVSSKGLSRSTKWAGEPCRYRSFGNTQIDTIVTGHLTQEQLDAYQQFARVEEISGVLRVSHQTQVPLLKLLPSGSLGTSANYKRDPSPPPKYDNHGNRTNTREFRTLQALEKERDYLVEIVARNIKHYTPPNDYRKPTKTSEKIYIPIKDYPDINFVGLLLGPRGNTLRQLQEKSGARLAIRGKGSVKDSKSTSNTNDDDTSNASFVNPNLNSNADDLHVLITSDTQLKIARAIKLTNEVIEKAISSPVGQNDLKRGQLRELAVLNGTLRETKPYDPEAYKNRPPRRGLDVALIVCKICGGVGHFARDCKHRGESNVPFQSDDRAVLKRPFDETSNKFGDLSLPPWKKQNTASPLPPWQPASTAPQPPVHGDTPSPVVLGILSKPPPGIKLPPPSLTGVKPLPPTVKPPPPGVKPPPPPHPTAKPPPPPNVKPPPPNVKPPPPNVKPPPPNVKPPPPPPPL